MAFFFDKDTSSQYCCVLFTQNPCGDCKGIIWKLNETSQRLTNYFPIIAYAITIFMFVELLMAGAQIVFGTKGLMKFLEIIDPVIILCTISLLIAFGAIQAYSQYSAKKAGNYHVFNHSRMALSIDASKSYYFYIVFISASIVVGVFYTRWSLWEAMPGNRSDMYLALPIFFLICLFAAVRLKWLWEKRSNPTVVWRGK